MSKGKTDTSTAVAEKLRGLGLTPSLAREIRAAIDTGATGSKRLKAFTTTGKVVTVELPKGRSYRLRIEGKRTGIGKRTCALVALLQIEKELLRGAMSAPQASTPSASKPAEPANKPIQQAAKATALEASCRSPKTWQEEVADVVIRSAVLQPPMPPNDLQSSLDEIDRPIPEDPLDHPGLEMIDRPVCAAESVSVDSAAGEAERRWISSDLLRIVLTTVVLLGLSIALSGLFARWLEQILARTDAVSNSSVQVDE